MRGIIFGIFFSMAVFVVDCRAKLGETQAQIAARYGSPTGMVPDDSGEVLKIYAFHEWNVGVLFLNGRSQAEIMTPAGDDVRLSDDDCIAFAKGVTGEMNWQRDSDVSVFNVLNDSWIGGSSGFVMLHEKKILESDHVMVFGKVLMDFVEKSSKSKSDRIAQIFGGVNSKKPGSNNSNQVFQITNFFPIEQLQTNSNNPAKVEVKKVDQKSADDARLMKWQLDEASTGDAFYQYKIGLRYLNGDGVAADPQQAREWLARAAAGGSKEARAALEKLPQN